MEKTEVVWDTEDSELDCLSGTRIDTGMRQAV